MYFLLFIFQFYISIQKSLTFEYIPENDLAKICRPVNRPIDLLFLLDGSGSVGGNTFQTQMEILDKLIDILEIGPGQNQSQLAVMHQLRQALQRIRHKSGTTKTGKALEKAIQLYKDKSSGARFGNVAKVVVVVPTAIRLRQTGVFLISLGIGTHVNLAELLQMSGDSEMVFDEQTENKSVERVFTDLFKRLSTAEACEFVRGGNGADIRCGSSVIEVLTTTKTKFRGLFYVQVLRIPLGKCGLEKQFSTNPKGYFFRGTAILQFHPNFRTGTDKIWK
uniref:VWFA domain-containing protein n=1 Tax=Meloidogyne javanica TaxID=6303 RepID=A0A915N190_MELJA